MTTWTGYHYPDPEHILLCLGSGLNYKPVRAYRFTHIAIVDHQSDESSWLPYPYSNLYHPEFNKKEPTYDLMPADWYFVLYMDPNNEFDPEEVAESLRSSYPQTYPYTWHVYQMQAIIVNQIDLNVYRSCNGLPTLPIPPYSDPYYPYRSPYRDLNPPFCADEEESLELALKQLSNTKSDIISDDLEYWKQHYTWKRKDDGEQACTICLAEFEIGEKIKLLDCEHGYHQSCIKEWLKVKNECPICRLPGYQISWARWMT